MAGLCIERDAGFSSSEGKASEEAQAGAFKETAPSGTAFRHADYLPTESKEHKLVTKAHCGGGAVDEEAADNGYPVGFAAKRLGLG